MQNRQAFESKLAMAYDQYEHISKGYYSVKLRDKYTVVHISKGEIFTELYDYCTINSTNYGTIIHLISYNKHSKVIQLNKHINRIINISDNEELIAKAGLIAHIPEEDRNHYIATLDGERLIELGFTDVIKSDDKDYIVITSGAYSTLYDTYGKKLLISGGFIHKVSPDIAHLYQSALVSNRKNNLASPDAEVIQNKTLIYKGEFVGNKSYYEIGVENIFGSLVAYGLTEPPESIFQQEGSRRLYLDTSTLKMIPILKLLEGYPQVYETANTLVFKSESLNSYGVVSKESNYEFFEVRDYTEAVRMANILGKKIMNSR